MSFYADFSLFFYWLINNAKSSVGIFFKLNIVQLTYIILISDFQTFCSMATEIVAESSKKVIYASWADKIVGIMKHQFPIIADICYT